MVVTGPKPSMSISVSTVKYIIREWFRRKHAAQWAARVDCRTTKTFLPALYEGQFWDCLKELKRQHARSLTYTVTGHNTLNRHLWKMGVVESPVCSLCGQEDETTYHYLGACDRYCALRYQIFGGHQLTVEDLSKLFFARLTEFIVKTGRFTNDQGLNGL